jgi:hypothetical protein
LRACAITSVARASQSSLWADRADIGLEEEPAIIFARTSESAQHTRPARLAAGLDGVVGNLIPILRIRWSILLSPANQIPIDDNSPEPYPRRPIAPQAFRPNSLFESCLHTLRLACVEYGHKSGEVGRGNSTTFVTRMLKNAAASSAALQFRSRKIRRCHPF